jgi:hypothetical protein
MRPGVAPVGGYTLLEVMIFLAVSSLLLFFTNVVFSGQAAHTEFVASMNNVNSKMQEWIDGVGNGLTGSTSAADSHLGNYVCTIDPVTNSPKLTSPQFSNGNAAGTNLPCIFLGKAIYANDVNYKTSLTAFTVLGKRTYNNGVSTVLADNLRNANPTAAAFLVPGDLATPSIQLKEEYKIPNGAQIRHAWSSTNAAAIPHDTLGGFFIDPSNASNSLLTVQYPFSAGINPTDSAAPDNLWPMATWNICFESTRSDERALLQVISSNGHGATTNLKLGRGDEVCS